VVFSSHILADVQEVCDTVGVLRAGRLLYQGPLDELLVGRVAPTWTVRLRDPGRDIEDALRAQPWVTSVRADTDGSLIVGVRSLRAAEQHLPEVLVRSGAHVISLGPQEAELEDVFLELTS
jgi:ABC-2 type transport system ATP-binding protein